MQIFRNAPGHIVIDWGEGNSPRYARYDFVEFPRTPPPTHVTAQGDELVHHVADDLWAPVYDDGPTGLTDVQRELLRRYLENLGVPVESACAAPDFIAKVMT